MKAVVFNRVGGPEVLEIVDRELEPPKSGEIRIRVTSAGLNRADTSYRRGLFYIRPEFPSRIGLEAAGIVDAVGESVSTVKIGDRVATFPARIDPVTQGGVAEPVTVSADLIIPSPSGVDDLDACAVWMPFLTAWGAINHTVKLQKNEFVVITAGSSSVAIAAVQIANHLGAVPIVTTTHGSKIEKLKQNGAAHVIDVKAESYVDRVTTITGGKGVGTIFDPVAGPAINDHLQVCQTEGCIILYGVLDSSPLVINAELLFGKMIHLRGYTIFPFLADAEGLANAVRTISEELDAGRFRLVVDRRFPMSQVQDAHRYMESNEQIGKIVINP